MERGDRRGRGVRETVLFFQGRRVRDVVYLPVVGGGFFVFWRRRDGYVDAELAPEDGLDRLARPEQRLQRGLEPSRERFETLGVASRLRAHVHRLGAPARDEDALEVRQEVRRPTLQVAAGRRRDREKLIELGPSAD